MRGGGGDGVRVTSKQFTSKGALPERHIFNILVKSGSIEVCTKFLCEEVAHVVALRTVAITDTK